jgi:hypothetical protein
MTERVLVASAAPNAGSPLTNKTKASTMVRFILPSIVIRFSGLSDAFLGQNRCKERLL